MERKKPELTILVGLSGSGKSTYAKLTSNFLKKVKVVSYDQIKSEFYNSYRSIEYNNNVIFENVRRSIRSELEHGYNVIYDDTNLKMRQRRSILDMVKDIDCNKRCLIEASTLDECVRKNTRCKISDSYVKTIEQLHDFQVPFYEEGFDTIDISNSPIISNKPNKVNGINKMVTRMDGFNQNNPHHTMALIDHAKAVSDIFDKKAEPNLYYGALLHDIGKLDTETIDNVGCSHYFHHENVGAYNIILNRELAYFTNDALEIAFYVNYHMLPYSWSTEDIKARWKRRFGKKKFNNLLRLNKADIEKK